MREDQKSLQSPPYIDTSVAPTARCLTQKDVAGYAIKLSSAELAPAIDVAGTKFSEQGLVRGIFTHERAELLL